MAHQSEYDFLFKVGGRPARSTKTAAAPPPPAPRSPPPCPHPQLLLIGDSGVGKSCLLLRFAVRRRRPPPVRALAPAARPVCSPQLPDCAAVDRVHAGRHIHGELHLHHRRGLCEWAGEGRELEGHPARWFDASCAAAAHAKQRHLQWLPFYRSQTACRKSARWSWTARSSSCRL